MYYRTYSGPEKVSVCCGICSTFFVYKEVEAVFPTIP
jgi:hypothetical protein